MKCVEYYFNIPNTNLISIL